MRQNTQQAQTRLKTQRKEKINTKNGPLNGKNFRDFGLTNLNH